MEEQYNKLFSQKKSSEVRLGQISEQMAPFLANFPYDPKKAHFIGQPIDYIIFEDDKIVILEVKSGQSGLSSRQKLIKEQVQKKKIEWEEYRIDGQMQETSDVQGNKSTENELPDVQKNISSEAPSKTS